MFGAVLWTIVGTIALLLALGLAFFGTILADGERDIIATMLTASAVMVAVAFGFFAWAALDYRAYRHEKAIADRAL